MKPHKTWGFIWDPNCLTFRLYISKKMGWNNEFLKILKETNIWKNYPACKELNLRMVVVNISDHWLHSLNYYIEEYINVGINMNHFIVSEVTEKKNSISWQHSQTISLDNNSQPIKNLHHSCWDRIWLVQCEHPYWLAILISNQHRYRGKHSNWDKTKSRTDDYATYVPFWHQIFPQCDISQSNPCK